MMQRRSFFSVLLGGAVVRPLRQRPITYGELVRIHAAADQAAREAREADARFGFTEFEAPPPALPDKLSPRGTGDA